MRPLPRREHENTVLELSPGQLKDHLAAAAEPPLLLDVREPWEYELTHLPESVLIPVSEIAARLDELDPGRETVVVCHHGIRSGKVAWLLARAGFERVINLRGGLDAWAKEVDPAMPVYTK